jgi:hypothetical protein
MPDDKEREPENDASDSRGSAGAPAERIFVHRILRYVPNLLRNEAINIGVLLYDPNTGEHRLRLIEEEAEFDRLNALHPGADELYIRGLRDHLESRIGAAAHSKGNGGPVRSDIRNGMGNPVLHTTEWFQILEKWDATLSQSLQFADAKSTRAQDINMEVSRLYNERIALGHNYGAARPNRSSVRDQMRNYMDQVFRQARLWNQISKDVAVAQYTLDKDPMKIDYSYLRNNGNRGFIQTISLSTRAEDAKMFVYTADKIREKASDKNVGISPEFLAVTDIDFRDENANHSFLKEFLGSHNVEHIPLSNAVVWVAKLRPMIQ